MSAYVPSWVKTDPKQLPRMQIHNPQGGLETSNVIFIFDNECWKSDTRAFAQLMQHPSQVDRRKTVIMVRVENEIGFSMTRVSMVLLQRGSFTLQLP